MSSPRACQSELQHTSIGLDRVGEPLARSEVHAFRQSIDEDAASVHDKALDLRSQRCGRRNQMRLFGLPSQPKAAMRTILAEGTTTMQKIQKALTFAIVCMVGDCGGNFADLNDSICSAES